MTLKQKVYFLRPTLPYRYYTCLKYIKVKDVTVERDFVLPASYLATQRHLCSQRLLRNLAQAPPSPVLYKTDDEILVNDHRCHY